MRMHDRFNPGIRNGEIIHDFKKLEDAPKAPAFLQIQDSQPRFRELINDLSINGQIGN
jgi:hypothetical protein